MQIKIHKTAASAHLFLNDLLKACPIELQKIQTDIGNEFSDRLFASRERNARGDQEFDQLSKALSIEHHLTKPSTPRTNGMVERFNGRITGVLTTHRFTSGEDLAQTPISYVAK
jgi:transposase InsO family protein